MERHIRQEAASSNQHRVQNGVTLNTVQSGIPLNVLSVSNESVALQVKIETSKNHCEEIAIVVPAVYLAVQNRCSL
ncbi:hypothetical protein NQZ68_034199 [Dissostichus eleginoides]|nr:hypothetical protein NQZ68_034199 [Dissostichus eleginoides]